MSKIKQKAITCAIFITIASLIGSIGCIGTGCKSKSSIQVIENTNVVTNMQTTKSFNDERYVWEENFYFSTNQVNDAKK